MSDQEIALGRALAELIGATGFYLGRVASPFQGDKVRLGRALSAALAPSGAFINFMDHAPAEPFDDP